MDLATVLVLSMLGVSPFIMFYAYFYWFSEQRRRHGEMKKLLEGIRHANMFLGLTVIYPALLLLYFMHDMASPAGPGYFMVPNEFLQMMVFLLSMIIILEIGSAFSYVYFSNKAERKQGK